MEPLPAAAMVREPHGSTSGAEGSGVLGAGRLSARSASRVWEAEGSEPATAHPQTQGALTILVGNVEGLQQCARAEGGDCAPLSAGGAADTTTRQNGGGGGSTTGRQQCNLPHRAEFSDLFLSLLCRCHEHTEH